MASGSEFPILDETWDMIDSSTLDYKLFRKVWLRCEAYLHARGYTLAHPDSEAYRAMFADCSNIPRKPPQDPFHPQADEAFWFMEVWVNPLKDPINTGRALFPTPSVHPALDARGRRVILKAVRASSKELKIVRLLSTNPLRAEPRNHTIPVLEILEEGDWAIIVTPEWGFNHWEPCGSIKEYVEFSRQLFEGLAFMHEHGIVHGDIDKINVVMNHHGQTSVHRDSLFDPFPRDYGPCGAKYAYIDFGESQLVHAEEDCMRKPTELRLHFETAAPELMKDDPVNIFFCDVYAAGALLKEHIDNVKIMESQGYISVLSTAPRFIQLIDMVTNDDPHKRPTAAEACAQFEDYLRELDSKDLHASEP